MEEEWNSGYRDPSPMWSLLVAIFGGGLLGALIGAVVGAVTYMPDPEGWDFGPGLNVIAGAMLGAPLGAGAGLVLCLVLIGLRRSRRSAD